MHKPVHVLARLAIFSVVLISGLSMTACGGGVGLTVGVGVDYDNDFTPPSVSIVVADGLVVAGQVIRVAAAASDENGIESASLYRRDFGGDRLVSSLGDRPFEWLVAVPSDGRGSVTYYVQAIDNAGNRANSNTVTIAIAP